jgi:hypothetical protein
VTEQELEDKLDEVILAALNAGMSNGTIADVLDAMKSRYGDLAADEGA